MKKTINSNQITMTKKTSKHYQFLVTVIGFLLVLMMGCSSGTKLFDQEMKNSLNGPDIEGHWQWRRFESNGDLVSIGELRLLENDGIIEGMSIPKSPFNNYTRLRRLPVEGYMTSPDEFEITVRRLIENGNEPILLKAVSKVKVAPGSKYLKASCEQQYIDEQSGQIKTFAYDWDAVPLPASQEESAQKEKLKERSKTF
ncbi:MAG: hypothetical protein SFT81_02950 [Candidatus Caenarcaniphilales bacterium]|nr:hypothetical protein [Candidatus Caenarcaniphilales bacterium]